MNNYLVVGKILVTRKFAKNVRADSAESAKEKVLKDVGSAGEASIDYVLVETKKEKIRR